MGVVFLSNNAVRKIRKLIKWSKEHQSQYRRRDDRRRQPSILRFVLKGKLDATLSAGGSATMIVWFDDGTSEAESDETVTVYDWLLKTGQTIANGSRVTAAFEPASGRYYVTAAECPTKNILIQDGSGGPLQFSGGYLQGRMAEAIVELTSSPAWTNLIETDSCT